MATSASACKMKCLQLVCDLCGHYMKSNHQELGPNWQHLFTLHNMHVVYLNHWSTYIFFFKYHPINLQHMHIAHAREFVLIYRKCHSLPVQSWFPFSFFIVPDAKNSKSYMIHKIYSPNTTGICQNYPYASSHIFLARRWAQRPIHTMHCIFFILKISGLPAYEGICQKQQL